MDRSYHLGTFYTQTQGTHLKKSGGGKGREEGEGVFMCSCLVWLLKRLGHSLSQAATKTKHPANITGLQGPCNFLSTPTIKREHLPLCFPLGYRMDGR